MLEDVHNTVVDREKLVAWLRMTGLGLGFSQIGIAGVNLRDAEPGLLAWLHNGFHGSMDYMARHGTKRARPDELVPGTLSVITARMDYLPRAAADEWQAIEWRRIGDAKQASVSLYARGRDYHKVLRSRLTMLADALSERLGPFGHRVFTDSAPLLEVELATRSGLGWRGKHTLALSRDAGSMFFLGEICVDIELPPTPMAQPHCGSCSACLDVCPTQAITEPYRLDARRCISYLTIEHDGPTLLELWSWDEQRFLRETEGSAIRRIGYQRWQRNLAVALGNALRDPAVGEHAAGAIRAALAARQPESTPLVAQHVAWALAV